MERRRILGLLGAGAVSLSGCVGESDDRDDSNPSTVHQARNTTIANPPSSSTPSVGETTTATETRSSDSGQTEGAIDTTSLPVTCPPTEVQGSVDEPSRGWPRISVASDQHPYDDVSMNATVISQFTDTCPAAIRVSLLNKSESAIETTFGWSYPFSVYESENSKNGHKIHLIPVFRGNAVETTWKVEGNETNVPTAKRDRCWSVDYQGFFTIGKPLQVQPDETVSNVYKVFSDIRDDECLPPGEYRFEQDGYMSREGTWGLSLSIESTSKK